MTLPEFQEFDLLGDPVPPGFNGRGRPPHTPSDEKRKLVIALWATGKSNAYCAAALGITEPTFNRHYFKKKSQKTIRDDARARIQALMINATLKGVADGNMAAVKQLTALMHDADMKALAKELANQPDRASSKERAKPPAPLGLKEQKQRAAEEIDGLYKPPSPPILN